MELNNQNIGNNNENLNNGNLNNNTVQNKELIISETTQNEGANQTSDFQPDIYYQNLMGNAETQYSKLMRENFAFFGPVTLLYALLYAFCMFKNGSGITFLLFIGASIAYLHFALPKLGLAVKKGSKFYFVSMLLLAVSTFCTDDGRIIFFNKTMIFFLVMSLLLHQFYDTSKWKLVKYLKSIIEVIFCSLGELVSPFEDAAEYFKKSENKNKNVWYVALGLIISIPIIVIVLLLLSGADAVFREVTNSILENINVGNILNLIFRICFIFFSTYFLIAYMCRKTINEDVKDKRTGEPVLAITITSLLTVIYLFFSGIQIIYLFLGQMKLPDGYTYAIYAREGFFQLLAVSILNLIIVLVCMSCFKESKVLKIVLTLMSACTFIMIASSALRMIMYIRYYYMTFLRIFVLWSLVVLFLLFLGIVISIYKESFPLFRYSMTVVTVLYIILSFVHPDYIIAKVNLSNASQRIDDNACDNNSTFFLADMSYDDFGYLCNLSADAAPAIIPYIEKIGYDLSDYRDVLKCEYEDLYDKYGSRWHVDGFGYYYMHNINESCEGLSIRTYNVSRHRALKLIEGK